MPTTPDDELRQQVEDICYWMYEVSGKSQYIRADRKPLHPDEARDKLLQLFADQRRRDAAAIKAMGPKNLALYPKDHRLSVEEIAEYNAPREQINDMNKRWRAAVDAVLLDEGAEKQ
jgi:hypothetical protein